MRAKPVETTGRKRRDKACLVSITIWIAVLILIRLLSHHWRDGGFTERGIVYLLRLVWLTGLLYIFGKLFRKARNLFFGLLPVSILFLLLEIIFFILSIPRENALQSSMVNMKGGDAVIRDRALGYSPAANSSIEATLKAKQHEVYDVTYDFDSLHRRITPGNDSAGSFVSFFGCSVTFGQGLRDTQTIPYYFSKNLQGYQAYNYAYQGYGTQQMLALLQNQNFDKGIRQKKGVGIYIFIEPHVNRVIGDLQIYTLWGADMPYFYLENDSLKRNGSFRTGRKWTSALYTILNRSMTLHYFHFNLPPKLKDSHYELTAHIISESKKLFEKNYPGSPFVVVLYPGSSERLVPFLRKYGIDYLDYSKVFDPKLPRYSMQPYDPHPNAYANNIIGKKLAKDVGILLNSTR